MQQLKRFHIVLLTVYSVFAVLLSVPDLASAAYSPLTIIDGEPTIAAHIVRLESGTVELALQVLAPGKTIEAVRIDNLGGVSSLWRSEAKDSTSPIFVSQGGITLSSGTDSMNFTPGDAEVLLSLTFKDNGSFYGKNTDFRVTLFFSDGERALCELSAEQIAQVYDAEQSMETASPAPQSSTAPIVPTMSAFKKGLIVGLIICIIIIGVFLIAVMFSKKRLLDKALTGDARAQFTAFEMYKSKDGKANIAMEFLSKSAEQGYLDAQIELGYRYQSGDGVDKNSAKAAELFEKAATQGSITAQYNLAICYQTGDGVEKDLVVAAGLFEKSAAQGHMESKVKLKEAKAESGDPESMHELAGLFFSGNSGVQKNVEKAFFWLDLAAEAGYARALEELGMRYLQGDGIQKDISRATRLLIEQGSADTLYTLAMCYKTGEEVEKNLPMAIELFEKSLAKGYIESELQLKKCKAESGDINSMYELGIMLFKNNEKEALDWLDKASRNGHPEALGKLNTFRTEQIDRIIARFSASKNSVEEFLKKYHLLRSWLDAGDPNGPKANRIWDESMRLYRNSPLDAVNEHKLIDPPSAGDIAILKASNDQRCILILKDIEKFEDAYRNLKAAQFNSRRK